MTAHRLLARIALVGAAPLLLAGLVAAPAQAHGAPDDPISRTVACGPEGGQNALSAACQAAIKLSGRQAFADWDNLRVANVRGRDREVIPDGKLCSGGIPAYRGLDLPRADWPATKLTSGAAFTFRYRETIPHKGTFRMYVTKDGYDPTQPLTWSDLEVRPFLTATDPPLTNGAYVMVGRLPAGKTGRHLIYTIWQNTSTPDTYYSCSDAVFNGSVGAAAPTNGTGGRGSNGTGSTGAAPDVVGAAPNAVPSSTAGDGAAASDGASTQAAGAGGGVEAPQQATGAPSTVTVADASSQRSAALPFAIAGAALLAMAALGGTVFLRRRQTPAA